MIDVNDFPKHECGMFLSHNTHKDYYETVEQYIDRDKENDEDTLDRDECIKLNEVWELQWYPNTPVGFYRVIGSTLEKVLARAKEIERSF